MLRAVAVQGRDWIAGGVGAVIMAIALLGGQRAMSGADRHERPAAASLAASARDADAPSGPDDGEQAWRTANANLAETVRRTEERLQRNEAEKQELERQLREAKARLAASDADGAPARNEFDLTQDDWKQLARTGTVKARYPCRFDPEWHIDPSQAAALGLSPGDVTAVEAAYTNEEDRLAGIIQTGCARILANAELARRLGTRVCATVVSDSAKDEHADLQLVADIRAGNVPTPPPDKLDPFAATLLAQTGSMQALQDALAPTLGPEEAHRVAFSDELGSCSGSWGGAPRANSAPRSRRRSPSAAAGTERSSAPP